jgi:hypothetical protein
MPARGIQHVDLCVRDVGRSLAFCIDVLRPLGLDSILTGLRIEVFCAKPPQSVEGRWTMKER